jgi:hypothetical protein
MFTLNHEEISPDFKTKCQEKMERRWSELGNEIEHQLQCVIFDWRLVDEFLSNKRCLRPAMRFEYIL